MIESPKLNSILDNNMRLSVEMGVFQGSKKNWILAIAYNNLAKGDKSIGSPPKI